MHVRALIVSLLVLMGAAVASAAPSIEFTPKLYVWDCPQGFQYPVMQCTSQEFAFPKQHLDFQDAGDGFWIADWDGSGAGIFTAYGELSFMVYPNEQKVVHLMANMSAGFDPDAKRNPGAFFETEPQTFPDWFMVTGEKKPNGDREILTTLEYADLKYSP